MSGRGVLTGLVGGLKRTHWPLVLLLMGLYIGAIYALMVQFIDPVYAYLGYTYAPPDVWRNSIVIGMVLGLALGMPRKITRPSRFVVWLHFLLATAPSMLVPQFTEGLESDLAFRFAVVVALGWSLVLALTSERAWDWVRQRTGRKSARRGHGSVRFKRVSLEPKVCTTILIALCVAANVLLLAVFGSQGGLVALTDVRDVRMGYREAVASAFPGVAYILLTTSNVINPVTVIRGLVEGRWVAVAAGALGQALIYSITGYKMVLLSVPALVVLYVWHRFQKPARGSLFMAGLVATMVVAWAAFAAVGSRTLAFLFVLRMVVAPGNLSAAYLAIFHDREPLYWGYSFMSRFVDYPYDTTPNYLVGKLFRHDPETSANVNLFGDGFMSMRWGGMLLECSILVLLLFALDAAAHNLSAVQSSAAVLLPTFAMANSNIFTSLTTHGFLAALALLAGLSLCTRKVRDVTPKGTQ